MIVYTAVFGGYDTVRAPEHPGDARWVCITDGPPAPPPWQTITVIGAGNSRLRARNYKLRPHRWFREPVTVWLDGNVTLCVPPEELLKYVEDTDIAAVEHSRVHHYAEADECLRLGKGDPERIRAQVRAYKAEGCPPQPVTANFLMVRRNTWAVAGLGDMWWGQVMRYSVRDQISSPYCLWKLGMSITRIPGDHGRGPDFVRHPHG